jgi:Na+/H+-translocating membrane pyrophosphatase
MIITVCPTELNVDDSMFTAQFATRVHNIKTTEISKNGGNKNLSDINTTLQSQLKDFLAKKTEVMFVIYLLVCVWISWYFQNNRRKMKLWS